MAPNGWDYNTYSTNTISSTTASDNPTYYSIGPDGEYQRIDMGNGHALPSHNHNNYVQWYQPPPNSLLLEGEEAIMRIDGEVHFKVKDDWVSVNSITEKINTLEAMVEKMYESLSPWQRDKNMRDIKSKLLEDEGKVKGTEHLDPDLFKV